MNAISSTTLFLPGLLALSIFGASFVADSQGQKNAAQAPAKIEPSDERSIYELGKWKKQAITERLNFAIYPMRSFENGEWKYFLHLLMDTDDGGSVEVDPAQAQQLVTALRSLERIRPVGMRSENLEVNLYGLSFAFAKEDAPGMNPGVRIIVGESASKALGKSGLKLLRDLLEEGLKELASFRELTPMFEF